jgi:tetratricopeptide (TPR) repeat protein
MSKTKIKNVLTVSSVADRLQLRIQSIAASLHEDPQAALTLCERTFVEARDQRLPSVQLQAAMHYGLIMDHLGRAAEARDWLFEALQLAQTQKLALHQAPLRELIARSYYTTGEYDRALQYWAECLEICERGGGADVRSWMLAKVGLGQIYDTLGDHASAVALHRSAHERINDVRDSYLDAKVKINLGVNLLRLDELGEAEQLFSAALALCRANFYHDYVAESLLGLAKVALARADLDAAFAHLTAALAEADRVGYSWGQSQILSALADAKARRGDLEGAMVALRRGQEISRLGGINHTLSQQHFALAHYAETLGDLRAALDETKAGLVLERHIHEQLSPDRRRELEDKAGLHPSSPQRLAGLLNNPLVDQGPVADFFQLLTRECCSAVGVARAGVWLLDADGQALRGVCIFDAAQASFVDPVLLPRDQMPALFDWLAQDHVLVAYDAAEHRDSWDLSRVYLAQRGVRSLLAFPLRPLDRAVGMLMVEHRGSQRNWTPADTLGVQQIADAATRALASRERAQFRQDIAALVSRALEKIHKAAQLNAAGPELAALLMESSSGLSQVEGIVRGLAGGPSPAAVDDVGNFRRP